MVVGLIPVVPQPAAAYETQAILAKAQQSVKQQLENPRGAEFSNLRAFVHEPLVVVCGAVNTRDNSGKAAGDRRFVVVHDVVLMQGKQSRAQFTNVEDYYCK
jgi:hypothetical protein